MSNSTTEDIQDAIHDLLQQNRLYATDDCLHPLPQLHDSARTFVHRIREEGLPCEDVRSELYFASGQQVSLDANCRLNEEIRKGPLRLGDIGIVISEASSWSDPKVR